MIEMNYMDNITIKYANEDKYSFRNCKNIVIRNAEHVILHDCENVFCDGCKKITASYFCNNLIIHKAGTCFLDHYCSALMLSAKTAIIKNCDFGKIDYSEIEELYISNRHYDTYKFTVNCNLRLLNLHSYTKLKVILKGKVANIINNNPTLISI